MGHPALKKLPFKSDICFFFVSTETAVNPAC